MKKSKTFNEDIFDIIGPNTGTEIGNDDFSFGNYVEWPSIDSLPEPTIIELLKYFDIDLPFGENLTVEMIVADQISDMFPKDIIFNDELLEAITNMIVKQSNFKNNIVFPEISEIRNEINSLLKQLGIPSGTSYEHEPDFPKSQNYWNTDDWDTDYAYYSRNKVELNSTQKMLTTIYQMIQNDGSDDLIIKSLISSAFAYVESFLKSTIYQGIPDLKETIQNEVLRTHTIKAIEFDLRGDRGRKDWFRDLYDEKLSDTPYIQLRNNLVHDVSKPIISNKSIQYLDKRQNSQTVTFENLFNSLSDFLTKISNVKNKKTND